MLKLLESVELSVWNRVIRAVWVIIWLTLYRTSPSIFHGWRCFLLRCFGARIGSDVHPYPSSVIWAPWNLTMDDHSCLGHGVICYNVAPVYIGKNATVSQFSHICTATHNYKTQAMTLLVAPVKIGSFAWVTADVFVGPGVTIGDGAVINARSSVFSDIKPWTVARGNPAKSYKERILEDINERC